MEFTIDFVKVRRIAAQESRQAQDELTSLGPLPAYQRSLQRMDEQLAAADDAASLACSAGCSWCCHFSVDVRPVEVFNILDFMRTAFSAGQQRRLYDEILTNSRTLSRLDEEQRMRLNIRCPFLAEGRCSIYAARPQTCRNYHATNAAGCRQSFEEPDNFDIAPEYAPQVYQAGGAQVEAFSRALGSAGYDIGAYELNTALAAALAQPLSRERFLAGLPAFVELAGAAVPYELTALEDE